MNKLFTKIALAHVILSVIFLGNISAQTWCTPTYWDGCVWGDFIQSFSTTGGTTNITNNNTGCAVATGYINYSATHIHTGTQGTAVNFSFTNNPNYEQGYKIWVDWNNNGVFTDAGEQVYASSSPILWGQTVTGSFTIPSTATPGTKRMRVRCSYATTVFDPCNLQDYGETEDYGLVVVAAINCATTTFPASATAISDKEAVCLNGDVNLNITTSIPMPVAMGITYQWQSSNFPNGPWVNQGTPLISPDATFNISSETYFRCQILCNANVELISDSVVVYSNSPDITSVNDTHACGPGQYPLSVVTQLGNSVNWYDAPVGGNLIDTGVQIITPYLTSTTTFYASAFVGGSGSTSAQSLEAHNMGGNSCSGGIMFNLTPTLDINVDSFEARAAASGSNVSVSVYIRNGTYLGNETNAAAWTLHETVVVPATVANQNFTIRLNNPIPLTNGNITGVYLNYNSSYTTQSMQIYHSNADLEIQSGAGLCSLFGGVNPNRSFNGWVHYSSSGCSGDRVPVTAYIIEKPDVDLGPDINRCVDPGHLEFLNAENFGATYQWDDNYNGMVRVVNKSGTYWVKVTNQYGCTDSDTINVTFKPNPLVDLGNDTTVCNGVTLNLNVGSEGVQYYWNTGQTTPTININNPGTYSVQVTGENGCIKTDSIAISMQGQLPKSGGIMVNNLDPYTFSFTCVNPLNIIGYQWSFGDGNYSSQPSPVHTYASVGNYVVTLNLTSVCGFNYDSISTHIYTKIDEIDFSNSSVLIYPNPTKEHAMITCKEGLTMKSIKVINVIGQLIMHHPSDEPQKHQLKLSGMTSGMYTVEIETDLGVISKKLEIVK